MYAVVQFSDSDGGTISIVNQQWLTPRKCEVYWPPVKGTKAFERLLITSSPDTNKWKLYGIQRIFCETDSIEKAKQKVKLAEVTSDLQTEEEETDVQIKPKRKPNLTKRYLNSSDEEEEDNLRLPPPLKKKFVDSINDKLKPVTLGLPSQECVSVNDNGDFHQSVSPVTVRETNKSPVPQSISPLPILSSSVLQSLEDTLTSERCQKELGTDNTRNDNIRNESTGYQEKVISLLSYLKHQNNEILEILRRKSAEKAGLDEDFAELPIHTEEQLNAVEIILQNREKFANLANHIKHIGGYDLSNSVSRAMKAVLKDCLAAKYNFYGKRSNKKAFGCLLLAKCVIGALSMTAGTTEKQVEDQVKIWLKHAPDRLKGNKANKA